MIALTLSGKIYTRHFEHALSAPDILVALKHFQQYISRPIIIIWDRLNAHRAVIVQEYVAAHPDIEMEWLPPYAPNLNPEEECRGTRQGRCETAPSALLPDPLFGRAHRITSSAWKRSIGGNRQTQILGGLMAAATALPLCYT